MTNKNRMFDGDIADADFVNRALRPDEVRRIYQYSREGMSLREAREKVEEEDKQEVADL